MRPQIIALAVLLGTLPVHAVLVPGPEKAASPIAIGAANAQPLAVASDGTDFVVVSSGGRWPYPTLLAQKVTATGALSPQPSTRIANGELYSAVMAWTGDAYLVMWEAKGSVMAARLDRDANLIDEPAPISFGTVHAVAWDGRRALAIANDNFGMKVLVLGASGNLVRENRLREWVAGDVRLVAAGDAFVAVWVINLRNEVATVRAMRLSRDGELEATTRLPFPTSDGVSMDAEAEGDRVGVAFTEWPISRVPRPLRRYTIDARTLTFTEHPVTEATSAPHVVATPGGFVSVLTTHKGATRTLDAIPFESTTPRSTEVPAEAESYALRTATNGRSMLAVWFNAGALFDAALTRRETPVFNIATMVISQRGPQIAAAGPVALHVWADEMQTGPADLLVARIDQEGNALDAPRRIATEVEIWSSYSVVFTGQVWLVAWRGAGSTGYAHMFLRRVGLDGVPLDEQPVDFGPSHDVSMASNGDLTLVAVMTTAGVHLYRFSPSGTRLDPTPGRIEKLAGARLTTNGHEFLAVCWCNDARDGRGKLMAKRISATGNVMDDAPIMIEDAPAHMPAFTASSDGTDYVVAYERAVDQATTEVVVKRVSRSGALEGSTASGGGTVVGRGAAPRIAFLGRRAVVSFVSNRGASPQRLYLAEVGKEAIVIAESAAPIEHAMGSNGAWLWLSYTRIIDRNAGISRVFVRRVEDTPAPRRRSSRH